MLVDQQARNGVTILAAVMYLNYCEGQGLLLPMGTGILWGWLGAPFLDERICK